MAINNGKYRMKTITIRKNVDGTPLNNGTFPRSHSILEAFGNESAITEEELALLGDAEYQVRLDAFYDMLEEIYDFFKRGEVSNAAHGTDTASCPIP